MADTFTVVRSTTINAPAAQIHPLINDFHRWSEWSPWEGIDPSMERTYSGADSGPGARYEWSGNRKAGRGTMTITDAEAPTSVTIDLAFLKPFKAENVITFSLAENGESTEVTWSMTGPMTLITKVMGVFVKMDKMVGPDFEKGLSQLKAAAERAAS